MNLKGFDTACQRIAGVITLAEAKETEPMGNPRNIVILSPPTNDKPKLESDTNEVCNDFNTEFELAGELEFEEEVDFD